MKVSNRLRIFLPLTVLLFLLGYANVKAQRIQVSANYLQGIHYTSEWALFRGGVELSADYLIPTYIWTLNVGLDVRTVQWGNQVGLSLGARLRIGEKTELGAELQNGFALFRPRPLYTFSSGINANYLFLEKEKFTLGASLEARYTVCPAYRKYSQVYSVLEIPVGLLVRF